MHLAIMEPSNFQASRELGELTVSRSLLCVLATLDREICQVVGEEDVAAEVQFLKDLLGFESLTIFPHLLGDSYKKADEQMARFAEEVLPLVS